jgi:hypothetical protein
LVGATIVAEGGWKVMGWDTFAREEFFIGEYPTEAEAQAAAERHAQQVSSHQDEALRDGVWVVSPKDGRPAYPPAVTVSVSENGVSCTWPDGRREAVGWENLLAIHIETTDAGPIEEDTFWVLRGGRGTCRVPHSADANGVLLERLQQLPGFNNEAVIAAMSSTDCATFACWQRTPA